jgi:hypothetical protein
MHINISPLNELSTHKILVYPAVPSELWVADLRTLTITSTVSRDVLAKADDDQGLYYRLSSGVTTELRAYCDKFDISHMLCACAKNQQEAPLVSNKFIIYDMYNHNGIIDPHLCSRACQYSSVFERPMFEVIHKDRIQDLYDNKEDIVFWGGSKLPRPLLLRDFDPVTYSYRLMDPYLQWSPPRFWYNMDFMDDIPDNIEAWISHVIDSFNWDYFYSLLEGDGVRRAELGHLIASIFDILYDEYIYYGICKKIWLKVDDGVDEHYQLLGKRDKQVLLNFTDIVNSIRETITARLLREELLPLEDVPVQEHVDGDLITDKMEQLFNKMEDNIDV